MIIDCLANESTSLEATHKELRNNVHFLKYGKRV